MRTTVEAAPPAGVGLLTLYAFSSHNWNRPRQEVDALMGLFRRFLSAETARCVENGVRLNVIGRRDRPRLRLAVDYSARDAMARASCADCSDRTSPGATRSPSWR